MKNGKFVMLLFVAMSVGFSACKKDKQDDDTTQIGENLTIKTPAGKSCVIKKVSYSANDYYTLEYDGKNRIIGTNYFFGGTLERSNTYTYLNNEIVLRKYYKDGTNRTTTYRLNNGKVISRSSTSVEAYNNFDYTYVNNTTFVYNDGGYLIKSTMVEDVSSADPVFQAFTSTKIDELIYQDGNLITKTESYSSTQRHNSNYSSTTTYEYYLDKANTLVGKEEDFFIKPSKNLVKKTTRVYNGQLSFVNHFSYTIDSDSLVAKKTESYGMSSDGDETSFQYSCK